MSVTKYISRIGRTIKSRLLGPTVTNLIRHTFSSSTNNVLNNKILDEALYLKEAFNLVNKKKHRELIIDTLSKSELEGLGYLDHAHAKISLATSPEQFCKALNIDLKYLNPKKPELRTESFLSRMVYDEPLKSKGALHSYQLRLKQELLHDIKNVAFKSHLCTMPTGAGKTTLAHETIIDLIRSSPLNKPFNFIWIVQEGILAEQSLKSFYSLWRLKGHSDLRINRFFGDFEGSVIEGKIPTATFATFTLASVRLEDAKFLNLLANADLLIIDEAHSSKAETYEDVIQKFRQINRSGQLLGLTATPYRPDDDQFDSVSSLFENRREITDNTGNKLSSPINHLIEGNYLSQVEFYELNISKSSSEEFEYYQDLHENILLACTSLRKDNLNCIIFAESMSHAVTLQLLLSYNKFKSAVIIGDTPPAERERLLNAFASKENDLNFLVNHEILSKGLDVPALNSIMILGKVGNPAQALQILGRAMRGPKNGGNAQNKIYLTKDNYDRISNFGMLEKITLNHE